MNGCSGGQNPYPRRGDVVPGVTALDLAKMHDRSLSNAVEVAALSVVALGSETTINYSIRLKKKFKNGSAVWVAGYSNDYTGYVASLRVLKEGGYEAQAG